MEKCDSRWSNQTDSGQNKLPPSKNRWKLRSKTYEGIAAGNGGTVGLKLKDFLCPDQQTHQSPNNLALCVLAALAPLAIRSCIRPLILRVSFSNT